MKKRIEISEETLKLLPFIEISENEYGDLIIPKHHIFNLGDHLLEDMATILGLQNQVIESTREDIEGAAYTEEATNKMLQLHKYIVENLFYIESLIHFYVTKGGLTIGTYVCNPKDMIWSKES